MNCPKHPHQRMTLLLFSYVCDQCDKEVKNGDVTTLTITPPNPDIPLYKTCRASLPKTPDYIPVNWSFLNGVSPRDLTVIGGFSRILDVSVADKVWAALGLSDRERPVTFDAFDVSPRNSPLRLAKRADFILAYWPGKGTQIKKNRFQTSRSPKTIPWDLFESLPDNAVVLLREDPFMGKDTFSWYCFLSLNAKQFQP